MEPSASSETISAGTSTDGSEPDPSGAPAAAGAPSEVAPGTDVRDTLINGFWEAAPLGMAVLDRELRYVRLNPCLAQFNKVSIEEHLGQRLDEVLPELAPLIEPFLQQVLTTGQAIFNHELRGQNLDGAEVRHWLLNYFPVPGNGGEIAGVGALVIESTNLKRIEAEVLDKTRALEDANTRLELLSRASAILSSSLDIETTLQSVARMAVPSFADWCLVDLLQDDGSTKRLALAHSDASKCDVAEAFYSLRLPAARLKEGSLHGIARVLATGEPDVVPSVTDEVLQQLARNDEHLQLLRGLEMTSYVSVPMAARGKTLGVLTFTVCGSRPGMGLEELALAKDLASRAALAIDNAQLYRVARDAQEHANLERDRAEDERERAQQAAHAKDEFLSILSHELRTPLTAACGWLQLHRHGKLDAETAQFALATVERSLATQSRLVNELLDSSQLMGGNLRLEIEPIVLAPLVEEAISYLEPAASAKSIRFDCSLQQVVVRGDAVRLQQILSNLIANAVKFSPPASTVCICMEAADGHATIRVADSGQGIEPEFLPYIFEPFRQAESSSIRTHGGLGMGLSVARGLAELHGGTVEAFSAGLNQGAVFTLQLPLLEERRKTDTGAASTQQPANAAPSEGQLRETPLLTGLHILVVEDDEGTRSWMELALKAQGAGVATATTMREGLDSFFSMRPDVIVSDISLPDADGYTLMERIRQCESAGRAARSPHRHVPAIALTAHTSSTDRLRALAAGFQLHIPKPVAPDELMLTIAALAGRSIAARV